METSEICKRGCFGKYVNSSSVCYECLDEANCISQTLGIKRTKSKRISKDDYYLSIALAVSKRSTCLRRHYGCVIVNNDEIIATGYNGSPRGEENCCDNEEGCKNLKHERNDGDYSSCPAVHSEQNAMLSASRKDMIGATMYLACENLEEVDAGGNVYDWIEDKSENVCPCRVCQRMVNNSGIKKIVTKNRIIFV